MNIVLIGLNHRTAPVEIREKLALDAQGPVNVCRELIGLDAVSEAIFFSTCNRVEVLFTTEGTTGPALEQIKSLFADQARVDAREFEEHLYVHESREAIRHLFRVASSLDSMVLGEPQILGQTKEAYKSALEAGSSGAVLNKLLHKAFSTAKRVRTETGVAAQAVSVGYASVELARKIFGDLDGTRVLLIGAGEMAELAAEHLLTQGASGIAVANRTLDRAVTLARRFGGQAAAWDEIAGQLSEVDIVISSTGAPETVIKTDMVRSVLRARKHRPLFFIDIAVPRDIDEEVNSLENVYLYNIDDLQDIVAGNRAARVNEAAKAERIVEEETIKFLDWLETLAVSPIIIALKDKTEEIRVQELKRTLDRLDSLSDEEIEALETMTKALIRKIIHDPIMFIKYAGHRGNKERYLELARKIFNID